MKIDEQWECWTLCAIKMTARNGGEKGRHLWPRLVQNIVEGKTSYELSWKVKVLMKEEKKKREKISGLPGWSSGNPWMLPLIVFVREFESRRGRDFEFICKNRQKGSLLLRVPSEGKHKSTRVRRGKKELKSSRDKNARHEPWWWGVERARYDPGSELRLLTGGREKNEGRRK